MAKPLLDVLAHRKPERRPVWLMRQAGRYLPEYREVRKVAGSFLKLCYDPGMAAEVTLQPLRRYDLDAAIIFADILVVPHALGLDLDFVENEGPVLSVVNNLESVKRLKDTEGAWQFERVYDSLRLVKGGLGRDVTLIGFCGAPWTVASYMIEGGSSARQKALRAAEAGEAWFEALIDLVVRTSIAYLDGQIRAGAEVVQIFDSWAGDLPAPLRKRWVFEPIAAIVRGLRSIHPGFPVIVFGRGLGGDHAALAEATGANAVSLEQDVNIAEVLKSLPESVAVQGNLAPELLLAGGQAMADAAEVICHSAPKARHVFNLGHGIMQPTPPDHVTQLIEVIRRTDGGA